MYRVRNGNGAKKSSSLALNGTSPTDLWLRGLGIILFYKAIKFKVFRVGLPQGLNQLWP